MMDAHIKKLRARHPISADEEAAIRALPADVRDYPRERPLIRAGQELTESMMLLGGWAARVKDLRSGQRQVSELNITGDFVDLHSYTLKRLDHDVVALSDCRVAAVPHERLSALLQRFPRLEDIYWFSTNLDAAIHREWALCLGRRSATSRLAHLFCEMRVRLGIVGLASDNRYDFPLRQEQLGECLGLTAVHINRTLQELRAMGLIRLEQRRVEILDLARLEEVAEFDPEYLYLHDTPTFMR